GSGVFWLLDCLGLSGGWSCGVFQGVVCAQGRERRRDEAAEGARVFRSRLSGGRFHFISAGLPEFSSLWQHLCGREFAGGYGQAGPWFWMGGIDPFLFFGITDGFGSGNGFHVVD